MRPDKTLIEERFKESIDAWATEGRPTGGFLLAVLENNLKEAVKRGDAAALDNLPHIVSYLYLDCPAACWGSPEKVAGWAKWISDPVSQALVAEMRKGTAR